MKKEIEENLRTKNPILDLNFGYREPTKKEFELLSQCSHLQKLNLREVEGSDFQFLVDFKNLKELRLGKSGTTNLHFLKNLSKSLKIISSIIFE